MRNALRRAVHKSLGLAWRLMVDPGKVVHFSGLRRAGNHACINWVANAVYGDKVWHRKLEHYLFLHYPGNRIFFINSYGQERAFPLFRQLWRYRKNIANCEYLFLSVEDEPPSFRHFLRPGNGSDAVRVHIRRSLFNTMASRAKKLEVDAGKPATGRMVDFGINEPLLAAEFAARRSDALQWDYDRWLEDPQWRTDFLAQLGLERDIMPGMSVEGGGSSFGYTGEGGPPPGTSTTRYLEHPVPEAWFRLVEEHFLGDLSAQELTQWQAIEKQRAHVPTA